MARGALTAAVRNVLADGTPRSTAEILAALPPELGANVTDVSAVCGARHKWREFVRHEKTDGHPRLRYSLDPAWVKPPTGGAAHGNATRKLSTPDAVAARDASPSPARCPDTAPPAATDTCEAAASGTSNTALSVSIGLVCGKAPQNPAQGRIEDALADAMPLQKPRFLSDVLHALPEGWSRAQAVSALTEGVLQGWIGSAGSGADRCFVRLGNPPPPRTDPLAERFEAMRLRARLEDIDRGLSELLKEPELPEHGDVTAAIRSARANTSFALKHIDI